MTIPLTFVSGLESLSAFGLSVPLTTAKYSYFGGEKYKAEGKDVRVGEALGAFQGAAVIPAYGMATFVSSIAVAGYNSAVGVGDYVSYNILHRNTPVASRIYSSYLADFALTKASDYLGPKIGLDKKTIANVIGAEDTDVIHKSTPGIIAAHYDISAGRLSGDSKFEKTKTFEGVDSFVSGVMLMGGIKRTFGIGKPKPEEITKSSPSRYDSINNIYQTTSNVVFAPMHLLTGTFLGAKDYAWGKVVRNPASFITQGRVSPVETKLIQQVIARPVRGAIGSVLTPANVPYYIAEAVFTRDRILSRSQSNLLLNRFYFLQNYKVNKD